MEIVWSKTARESFKVTLRFIRSNLGDTVAKNIRQEIEKQVILLSYHPLMGREDEIHSIQKKKSVYRYQTTKQSVLLS